MRREIEGPNTDRKRRISYLDLAIILPLSMVVFAAKKSGSKEDRIRASLAQQKAPKRETAAARLARQKEEDRKKRKKGKKN